MFEKIAECSPTTCTTYVKKGDKIHVHRHWFKNLTSYVYDDFGDTLYMYPSDEFEFMHVKLNYNAESAFTRSLLRERIQEYLQTYTSKYPIKVSVRNRLVDDIYINGKASKKILGSMGSLSCRIKFWGLKKTSRYPHTSNIVPRELGIIQNFQKEKEDLLILNVGEFETKAVFINDDRLDSMDCLNVGVKNIIQSFTENGISDMDTFSMSLQSNPVVRQLVEKVLDLYVDIYCARLGDFPRSHRILLQGAILHYPNLTQYIMDSLSKYFEEYVGLYIGSEIDIPGREWSSDDVYIKTTMTVFGKYSTMTSFSTPTT